MFYVLSCTFYADTTQLFKTSDFTGPGYNAALSVAFMARAHCSVVCAIILSPIRKDLLIAAYCPVLCYNSFVF